MTLPRSDVVSWSEDYERYESIAVEREMKIFSWLFFRNSWARNNDYVNLNIVNQIRAGT